jgi:hypothetical protein
MTIKKIVKVKLFNKVSKIVGIIKKNAVLWIRHFGTDPDQRIRNIELRIRILLFRQWLTSHKMQTKNKFFFKVFFAIYFLKVHLHQVSKMKSQKEVTK